MAEMIPADQGRIITHVIPKPSIGVDFSGAMPVRTRWRIIAVIAWLTTDATAVDRHATLRIGLGADTYVAIPLRQVMTASNAYTVCWFSGADVPPITGGLTLVGNLPEKLLINNEMVIFSDTDNLETMDEWDEIFVLAEEWIEPLA